MVTIIFMNLLFTLVIASTKSAFGVLKSFPYENHSKCYKKAGIKIVTLAIYTYLIYIMRLFWCKDWFQYDQHMPYTVYSIFHVSLKCY